MSCLCLLDILPVARQAVVDNMADGLLVLDAENRVVDTNPAMRAILGQPSADLVGQPIEQVLPNWPVIGCCDRVMELCLTWGAKRRSYDLHVSPLHDRRRRFRGCSIVFHDITDRQQAEDELRALASRQSTLYEVLRAVGGHLDPNAVAYVAVEAVSRLTGWAVVSIHLSDSATNHLVKHASAGKLTLGPEWQIPVTKGVVGRAFRTAQTQLVVNVCADPDYVQVHPDIRSELAVPLRCGQHVLGVLNLESEQLGGFGDQDVLLAESLAEAIALALDNARFHAETQRRLAEQTALREAVMAVSSTLEPQDVLAHIARQMAHAVDATSAYICSYNLDDMTSTVLAEFIGPSACPKECLSDLGVTYAYDDLDFFAAMKAGLPDVSHVDDPQLVEMDRQHMETYGAKTVLYVPLHAGGQIVGFAELWESRCRRDFTAAEIALCQSIAQQAAVALERARLFQAAEEERGRLRAIVNSSRDGIVLLGMDMGVLFTNAAAIEMLGLDGNLQKWTGRSLPEVIAPLRHRVPAAIMTVLQEARRVRAGGDAPGEGEFDMPPRTIHWLNLPVRVGQVSIGRLVVLRDVTEARVLERLRNDLLHTMVHDLRSPLSIATGALDLMGGDLVGEQRQAWEIARASTAKTLRLVNAILDISRLECGQMPLLHSVVALGPLVSAVLDEAKSLAAEKRLRLEQDTPAALSIWCDGGLIERVLQNLVDNALKFTPAGGTIRVAARLGGADNSTCVVSVSDSGPGIPPEVEGRLFQKFVTGLHPGRGSGLGLAFCRMVVEAHGGHIWLENVDEGGARFVFSLPLLR